MSAKSGEKKPGKIDPSSLVEDIRHLWGILETLRITVIEVHDSLPPSVEELAIGDLGSQESDATRIRADLRCLLMDCVEPGLRTLANIESSLVNPTTPPSRRYK